MRTLVLARIAARLAWAPSRMGWGVTDRPRGLSISAYALIMMLLVTVVFVGYGLFTHSEFQRVRGELLSAGEAAAHEEVEIALDLLLGQAEATAETFSAWDEVAQQLRFPRYYTYWRDYRLAGLSEMPEMVADIGIYDRSGESIVQLDSINLPHRVATPPPPSYVESGPAGPTLLVFRPVTADPKNPGLSPDGYVGMRFHLLSPLRKEYPYRYIDPQSIQFEQLGRVSATWAGLKDAVRFTLRPNPMNEAVATLLSQAVVNLSGLLAVLVLFLVPALVVLIVRPLRAISRHIDYLKANRDGEMLEQLAGILPIAETEKIRRSLNEFQSQLIEVHHSLEDQTEQLWLMAHHDSTTGVKNRLAFDEFMQRLPRTFGESGNGVCFILFDVNHFKAINDSYGHGVGDEVLKVIAGRIDSSLRRGEEMFRIGGDEFAVILLDCDEQAARRIAERCHEKIVDYDFGRLGVREPLRVSAGLASARLDDLQGLQTLQWKTDVAMHRAKRPGNANVVVFDDSMAADSEGLFSSRVNTAVFEALRHTRGLRMYYQPIVNLDSGDISHYEALARIEQDGEVIMPGSIFPIVEARRLDVEMDRAVISTVAADLRAGRVQPATGVSINLSGPSVVNARVCTWLSELEPYVREFRVMLEVTETALITQIGLASTNLRALRAKGFEIALDDFGSGYSSLRYLAAMPVDAVKFDISLIQGLRDDKQATIVTHLARMIRRAGHQLVAEGIEDRATVDAVRAAGFDHAQGFLFGHPTDEAMRRKVVFDNVAVFPSGARA